MQANKDRVATSAIEVLRIVDETLEAFFLLPIPMQPALVTELTNSLDRCLQHYILKAKSGCGKSRIIYIPFCLYLKVFSNHRLLILVFIFRDSKKLPTKLAWFN